MPAIRGDKGEPTQRDGWHLVNQTLVTTEWLTPVNNSTLSYNETAERERERERKKERDKEGEETGCEGNAYALPDALIEVAAGYKVSQIGRAHV